MTDGYRNAGDVDAARLGHLPFLPGMPFPAAERLSGSHLGSVRYTPAYAFNIRTHESRIQSWSKS
jgi:hypothetical protein